MPAFMLFFEFVRVKELVSWYFVQERVFLHGVGRNIYWRRFYISFK